MKKRLLSLLMALCLCLGMLPAAALAAEDEPRDTNFFTQREHTDLKYEDLEYARPDGEAILAKMEEARALLADKANMEKVSALFDSIGEDFAQVRTMYALCNIQAYQDVTSEAWDELEVLRDLASNLSDQLSILMKDILNSPCDVFLAEQLDEESVEYYKNYTPMTEEQLAFAAKEAALESEYQTAAANLPTVEVDGVTYDEDSIYYAYASGEVDYDTYSAAATQLAREKNALLGEIYLRMVELRQAEAKSYGYDNYAEYAYAEIYTRDYTPEEVRAFHEAVKTYIAPLYSQVYDLFRSYVMAGAYEELNAVDYSGDVALDMIEPYLAKMSDELLEAFTFMREGGYYDSEISETKASAGFTTSLPAYGAPFFFNASGNGLADFITTVHEFGHYNESYWASNEFIDYSKNIDIAEVHSQGMELMFSHWYPEIFGEDGADAMETYLLLNLLNSVMDGCLHDELQQYVYYTPNVTLQQINQKYRTLMTEYGQVPAEDPRTEMYSWVDIPHTFMQPCYYISYAVSAAGAFSFWLDAQENDYYEALDNYLEFTALPGSYTFTESFEQVGLDAPMDPDYVRALAGDLSWKVLGQPLPGTYEVAVNVNGTYLQFPDAQPTMVNNRTMIPLRAVLEALGAELEWDEATYQVTVTRGDTTVVLKIGENVLTVTQGETTTQVEMDVAPYIALENNRTYVPVRFVSEAFGFRVGWDEDYRTAIILDMESVAAALLEGRSFTYLEKLARFMTRQQEGKDQGTWNTAVTAEGAMTVAGALQIPMTMAADAVTADQSKVEMDMSMKMDLTGLMAMMAMSGSAPDAGTQALVKTLAQDGLGFQYRGDVETGKLYFTAADALLEQVGVEAGTWFLMDMNAMGEAMGEDYAALMAAVTAGNTDALLDWLSSGLKLDSVDEVAMAIYAADELFAFLSDESFEADGHDYTTVYTTGDETSQTDMALTLTMDGDTVTDVTVQRRYAVAQESGVVVVEAVTAMDSAGAVAGQVTVEAAEIVSLELAFTAQTVKGGDRAPQTEPPAGATVLDLSDPEVMDQLTGVMPLPEDEAA